MSRFSRAPPPPGTRRTEGGLLLSTGCATLDAAVGGGWRVGTLVLLEEDSTGDTACGVTGAFAAEGIAWQQQVGFAADDTGGDWLQRLPRKWVPRKRLHPVAPPQPTPTAPPACCGGEGACGSAQSCCAAVVVAPPFADVDSDEPDAGWDGGGAGLRTAWQYRKYLPPRTGEGGGDTPTPPVYCHRFDLRRTVPLDEVAGSVTVLAPTPEGPPFYDQLATLIGAYLEPSPGAPRVSRLVVRVSPTPTEGGGWAGWAPFLQCLGRLRAAASASTSGGGGAVVVVSLRGVLPPHVAAAARTQCDVALKLHGTGDPPAGLEVWGEAAVGVGGEGVGDAAGLLLLRRPPRGGGSLAPLPLPGALWLYGRSGGALQFSLPHPPPEPAAAPEGGLSCGGGGGGGDGF